MRTDEEVSLSKVFTPGIRRDTDLAETMATSCDRHSRTGG